MNIQELEGAELDAAVARILFGEQAPIVVAQAGPPAQVTHGESGITFRMPFRPSTDWAQGGPIIEWGRVAVVAWKSDATVKWSACCEDGHMESQGGYFEMEGFNLSPTPLKAAMRAYVAAAIRRGSV